MNLTNLNEGVFTNKHISAAFYPSNGEIFTSQKNAFTVDNAVSSISLKEDKKLPLYIFFGEIKINEQHSAPTTNGILHTPSN
jgi:hypothetical protein